MKQELASALYEGRYTTAITILHTLPLEEQGILLHVLARQTRAIACYTAYWLLLQANNSPQYHFYATRMLLECFNNVKGHAGAAQYHIQCALAQDPGNTKYQELYATVQEQLALLQPEHELAIIQRVYPDGPLRDIAHQVMRALMAGNMHQARELLTNSLVRDHPDILIALAIEYQSIALYTLVWTQIQAQETVELHRQAEFIMSDGLVWLTGAYSSALIHARRKVDLAPTHHALKENVLFFGYCQPAVLSPEETQHIAHELLKHDPENQAARCVLS